MAVWRLSSAQQHDHHNHSDTVKVKPSAKKKNTKSPPLQKDTIKTNHPDQTEGMKKTLQNHSVNIEMDHHDMKNMNDSVHDIYAMTPMTHAYSLNLPMSRNGSGTGWLPDSTPMYGYMIHGKKWMYMIHGNVFARYNHQDIFNKGSRGGEKLDAVNWIMGMGQRTIGKNGLFRFSAMLSFDNLFGGNGYPLLFQTGESWLGEPLVDRQHPHDLFSELSLAYSHAINKNMDVFIYAGYPGEPALGSVAFMHRVSSLYGPDAPLSHHWNDGTHITFGVITAGIRLSKFKLDGSTFKGREPDEYRNNFDTPKLDSYSGRLSFNPNPYLTFQLSQGFVRSPEATRPDENVYRTTAAMVWSKPMIAGNFLNVTALWGLNRSHGNEHAVLLEAALVIKRLAMYGRYEYVEKSAEELNLDETIYSHDARFSVNALTLGMSLDIVRSKYGNIAFGGQLASYLTDKKLWTLYGTNPVSTEVFIRFYPPRMNVGR